ncbi:hypothetical protein B0H13DRAFT_1921826 [Mycena leptocephala]|nr:hypothetical protein B0H13DRAFT_1921826 [Mycena leptocephala]
MVRLFVNPTASEAFLRPITARLYAAHQPAALVSVTTRCTSTSPRKTRYPFVETVMNHSHVQTFIHDVAVLVHHQGSDGRSAISKFRVFFKRHVRLPYNRRPDLNGKFVDLKGDIVVMRIAHMGISSFVNLRPSDDKIADFIVAALAEKVQAFQGSKRRKICPDLLVMPFNVRARARRVK